MAALLCGALNAWSILVCIIVALAFIRSLSEQVVTLSWSLQLSYLELWRFFFLEDGHLCVCLMHACSNMPWCAARQQQRKEGHGPNRYWIYNNEWLPLQIFHKQRNAFHMFVDPHDMFGKETPKHNFSLSTRKVL